MSQYQPDIDDLLRTVREYVQDLSSKLKGGDKYNALVAAYLLGICERELRYGPSFDDKEKQALAKFLKSEGSLEELQKALCVGIRAGKHDGAWNDLLRMLLAQTVSDVSVVRPDHLADMHRTSKA